MRLLLTDHIFNAYESLRANRMRTILTALGVAIGVASITVVLSLSGGVTSVIGDQVKSLEGNIAVIRPAAIGASDISQQQSFAASTLSENDLDQLKTIPNVKAVVPLMIINSSTRNGSTAPSGTSIVATTPGLESIAGLEVRDGQFLDLTTNQQTAVIGQQLSIDLFGTGQSIGQTFTVRGQEFTVIGILKRMDNPINFNTVDFDHTAIIHLAAGAALTDANTTLQQINIRASSTETLPGVIKNADRILSKSHKSEKDYTIVSGDDIAKPTSRLFTLVQQMTVAVASVSLLVGGIGIMNILLVSVAERTREIGLRKAIGASNAHIIWQFLIESIIISLVGGVVGYVLGYLSAFIISTFLTFSPALDWQIAVIALGVSGSVGVLFGLYPALRAARNNPIESLRHFN